MAEERRELFSDPEPTPRRRWSLPASLAIHALLLLALLRGRSPVFVAPSSILKGANGSAITQLYWDPRARDVDALSAETGHAGSPLTWKRKPQHPERVSPQKAAAPATDHEMASAATPAPPVGSPYGSLTEGPNAGVEIRPALPVTTSEPLVSPEELHGLTEGNVVVEITIDENGNIVSRTVVQSLGPAIDEKVLAALDNWHFRPATRDGVPIPSKQDVVYHFKPR